MMRLMFCSKNHLLPFIFLIFIVSESKAQQATASVWLTRADRSVLFAQQKPLVFKSTTEIPGSAIRINDKQTFQTIDGFGYALTGGSAMHMIRMKPAARTALIRELFARDGKNIGVSYIRLSIGASDLNEHVFSYDDLPEGETDTALQKFDLGPDREDVIPVMKEILKIAPDIKIMGSPWSPPTWMKTNNDTRGGRLKPEYYPAYAKYFVKYVQEMKKEGIIVDAITIQNEPLHPGNNPSLLMTAPEQAEFIKDHLGPAFRNADIKTKIIVYDHNANRPDYPILILNDPDASKYVDGSAFHLYAGKMEALSEVHERFPDKHLYFSEQMVIEEPESKTIRITSPVNRLVIGGSRNWSRVVLLWNLAADPENKPFTDRGGCPMCQGAVTIDKDEVTRNLAYYAIAHASKFVVPGSVRIGSNSNDSLSNVAFKTPGGKFVVIVSNNSDKKQNFSIVHNGKKADANLEAGSVATYTW